MYEFLILLNKLYPLYLVVLLGFLGGRFLKVDRRTISTILIYVIAPVVVFYGVATAPHNDAYLLLPIIFFVVACSLSAIFFLIGSKFWQTSEKNLLSFVAGSANTGYFGIPLSLALFGNKGLSIAALTTFGLILYESTRGYYIMAKSHASAKAAIQKVLTLPVLYAFIAGVVANRLHLAFPDSITTTFIYFTGTYIVLGMMILGITLSLVTRASFDKTFTLLSFSAKFVCYPLIIGMLIYLDSTIFKLFSNDVHAVVMILSLTPMATNAVSYATYLKAHPEKAAFTIMLSTLFALIYIPLFIAFFIK